MRRRYTFLLMFLLCVGCLSNTPKRIQAPKWNPDAAADAAMSVDSDGDGFLSAKELKSGAPGLLAALAECDEDKDKKLSRDEVLKRIELYQETRTGLMECRCKVTYKNRPLANGQVRFVPESFLGDSIEGAYGETRPDGTVTMGLEDSVELYVRPGMYKVEITSDSTNIPAKYNTESTLGIEVAPVTTMDQTGVTEFRLK